MDRNFFHVRHRVERVIREGDECRAREETVRIIDDWAAQVIAAHLGTTRFPIQVQAEFIYAAKPFFGMLGGSPRHSPETANWVADCNLILLDRLGYWTELSMRFNGVERSRVRNS